MSRRFRSSASLVWRKAALLRIRDQAAKRAYITTDDIFGWGWLKRAWSDIDPRTMGPAMQAARRAGLIERTNITHRSTQGTNHTRPVAVWKSLVFKP